MDTVNLSGILSFPWANSIVNDRYKYSDKNDLMSVMVWLKELKRIFYILQIVPKSGEVGWFLEKEYDSQELLKNKILPKTLG